MGLKADYKLLKKRLVNLKIVKWKLTKNKAQEEKQNNKKENKSSVTTFSNLESLKEKRQRWEQEKYY